MCPEHGYRGIQLVLRDHICTGQQDRGSSFYLIVVELTEVLHIDLHLAGIYHGCRKAQLHRIPGNLFHRGNHVGKLAHAGRLNNDSVRCVFLNHLGQRPAKVSHQAAANTTGVHFGNVDAGLLHKAPVNANLAELIFDQHQLLSRISFRDHFLDQRRLTGA